MRNEHFELLHGGAVSQELSSGAVAIFICPARLLQLFESFSYVWPLWLYKNKWGNGKMKTLKCNSHELHTIETKVERGSD